MVTVVVVGRKAIGRVAQTGRLGVATVKENLVYRSVFYDKAASKEVVVLVCTHDLALGIPLQLHAECTRHFRNGLNGTDDRHHQHIQECVLYFYYVHTLLLTLLFTSFNQNLSLRLSKTSYFL